MHSLVINFSYLVMLFSPVLLAARNSRKIRSPS
jgi:hypothetical protein